jgi:hypothetical protein
MNLVSLLVVRVAQYATGVLVGYVIGYLFFRQ